MKREEDILVIGSKKVADIVGRELKPRSHFRIQHSETVSVDILIEGRRPDLAVVDAEALEGEVADTLRGIARFQGKIPIVVLSSHSVSRTLASSVTAVLPTRQLSSHLSSVVALLLYVYRTEQPLRTEAIPLGIVDVNVAAGEHVGVLLRSDAEFQSLARYWSVADNSDSFILYGSREAIHVCEKHFASEGLEFNKLRKDARLTILEAATLDAGVMELVAREVVKASKRGSKLVRIVGAAAGWTPKDKSEAHIWEHLLSRVIKLLPAVMVCPYRIGKFDGSTLFARAIDNHPLLISGNEPVRNCFWHG
jgi:hypothetical protein